MIGTEIQHPSMDWDISEYLDWKVIPTDFWENIAYVGPTWQRLIEQQDSGLFLFDFITIINYRSIIKLSKGFFRSVCGEYVFVYTENLAEKSGPR